MSHETKDPIEDPARATWLRGVYIALHELAAELRRSDLQDCSRSVELAAESVRRILPGPAVPVLLLYPDTEKAAP